MSNSTILQDLAVVVVTAAGAALLAPRLRLPALPAYLLAGIALGRMNAGAGKPLLGDVDAVSALSNLGVTFLMFAIGLEFDFRKARPIFVPALLANLAEFIAMFALGGAAAALLGFTRTEGIFLGGLLGVSSTMVTLAALQDKGHLDRNYGRLTVGVLVLEDVVAVVLLVLLSGLGATQGGFGHGSGAPVTVWQTILYLGAFVTALLTLGRLGSLRWLPSLKLDEKPELLAPMVGGVVLGVGLLAERFSFSPALGAFVIGASLAETKMAARIGEVAEPFRNMFSAVFFVTLGVAIDPALLVRALPAIVPLTLLMMAGKALACWGGAFLGGQKSSGALRMALSKANIGEFSFVIAALGERAGVTGPEVTATAAGVALLSILLNRPLVRRTDAIVEGLGRRMPGQLRQAADFYGNLLAGLGARLDGATLWRVMRGPLSKVVFHFVFFVTIVVAAHMACLYLGGQIGELLGVVGVSASRAPEAVWLLAGPVTLPFVVALAHQLEASLMLLSELAVGFSAERGRAHGLVARLLTVVVMMVLSLIFLAFAAPWLPGLAPLALLVLLAGLAWFFRGALGRAQSRFEVVFLESFNETARSEEAGRRAQLLQRMVKRHKWPLHLREYKVAPHTRAAGSRIGELDLRQRTGAFVMAQQRGGVTVFAPGRDAPVFPEDELMLLGTREQLDAASKLLGEETGDRPEEEGFLMEQVFVAHDSPLAGESLAGIGVRRQYGVTVAGVQRGETQHISPGPDFIVKSGDILLVAGEVDSVTAFRKVAAGGLAGAV